MDKKYKLSLFIFRRDLRLEDNLGLIKAVELSQEVISCFIFDPRQIGKDNEYRSNNSIQFMIESLQDLNDNLKSKQSKLYVLNGVAENIVEKLIKSEKVDAVFFNRDYTLFSIKRDKAIEKICNKNKIDFYCVNDLLLTEPEEVLTGSKQPYSKFTPFCRKAASIKVSEPKKLKSKNFYNKKIKIEESLDKIQSNFENNENIAQTGGRNAGLKILKNIDKFEKYNKQKDFPAIPTTLLSGHNKFGTVSIREVYWAIADKLGKHHPLIRQLYWRDFFTHIVFNSPYVFGHSFNKKFTNISWKNSKPLFELWKEGKTGFPIVDAGMRQLNRTGFMHNRVRLITASFLVKDLHINWQWGEKYFAQKLVDYDPAVNNGNWQWVASTGADAQPYFRIFNPWLQQAKFDPDCEYIKQWVPELKNVAPKIIHNLYKNNQDIKNYPKPIVDHAIEAKLAKQLYLK